MPLTFCIAGALLQGQISAKIYAGKVLKGRVEMSQKLVGNGQLAVHVKLTADAPGSSLEFNYLYDKTGMPISEDVIERSPRASVDVSVAYGSKGVTEKAHAGSQSRNLNLPYPKGADLRDPTAFWFIRDHVKPGAVAKYTEFDVNKQRWIPKVQTYSGDEMITYNGQKVRAHKIKSSTATVWLDDHALPYKMTQADGSVIVRD
jgi:hypothetical protein